MGIFALSTNFLLSLVLLAITGLANSLQAVMRQTTFHLFTPDQVRGRAFAVFHMFSQGANGFGATEIGFVAALLGAPRRAALRLRLRLAAYVNLLGGNAGIEKIWYRESPQVIAGQLLKF